MPGIQVFFSSTLIFSKSYCLFSVSGELEIFKTGIFAMTLIFSFWGYDLLSVSLGIHSLKVIVLLDVPLPYHSFWIFSSCKCFVFWKHIFVSVSNPKFLNYQPQHLPHLQSVLTNLLLFQLFYSELIYKHQSICCPVELHSELSINVQKINFSHSAYHWLRHKAFWYLRFAEA